MQTEEIEQINQDLMEDMPTESTEEQRLRDESIVSEINRIKVEYGLMGDRVNIIANLLKEAEDLPATEKATQLKGYKKSLLELQNKLEKEMLKIDTLLGASEKVRPLKKAAVNDIHRLMTEIDQHLKLIAQKEQQSQQSATLMIEQETSTEDTESSEPNFEGEKEEEEQPQETVQPELKEQKLEEGLERLRNEFSREQKELDQKRKEEAMTTQSQQEMDEQEEEGEEEEEELSAPFPLPTKEDWKKLKFEAELDIRKAGNKIVVTSNIPNLDKKDISVKAVGNRLHIAIAKYPTKEELKWMLQEFVSNMRRMAMSAHRFTKSQLAAIFLKFASRYNAFGSFSTVYELPHNFDKDEGISASYEDGVLSIEIPTAIKPRFVEPLQHQNPFYSRPIHSKKQRAPSFWDFF